MNKIKRNSNNKTDKIILNQKFKKSIYTKYLKKLFLNYKHI